MPSSASLPDSNTQPQNDTAAVVSHPDAQPQGNAAPGAIHLEDIELELKTLQLEAKETQQTLKKLQTQPANDPVQAMLVDLPPLQWLLLGVAGVIALALLWRYWLRRSRLHSKDVAQDAAEQQFAHSSKFDPVADFGEQPADTVPPSQPEPQQQAQPVATDDDTEAWPTSQDPQQQHEEHALTPNGLADKTQAFGGFDSEAAAGNVMRVRKSLAEKREARAHHILEREDVHEEQFVPSVRAWPENPVAEITQPALELPHPADHLAEYDHAPEPVADLAPTSEAAPRVDPWRLPGESPFNVADLAVDSKHGLDFSFSLPQIASGEGAQDAPQAVPPPVPPEENTRLSPGTSIDIDIDIGSVEETPPATEIASSFEWATPAEPASAPALAEKLVPQPAEEPYPDSSATTPDYAVTLALAEESLELELWPEARDLAVEVLGSSDEKLRAAAQSLLDRLKQLETAMAEEDIPWQETR